MSIDLHFAKLLHESGVNCMTFARQSHWKSREARSEPGWHYFTFFSRARGRLAPRRDPQRTLALSILTSGIFLP